MAHLATATTGVGAEEFPCDILGPLAYEEDLLVEPLQVRDGAVRAPDKLRTRRQNWITQNWRGTALPDRRVPPQWVLIGYLWVCYALNHADRQIVYSLFPALQKEFGYSDAVLGLTGALFLWVYGACSPLAGIVGDRF